MIVRAGVELRRLQSGSVLNVAETHHELRYESATTQVRHEW